MSRRVSHRQIENDLVNALRTLDDHDPENAHIQADTLVMQWLLETHPAVAAAWTDAKERIGFWYA